MRRVQERSLLHPQSSLKKERLLPIHIHADSGLLTLNDSNILLHITRERWVELQRVQHHAPCHHVPLLPPPHAHRLHSRENGILEDNDNLHNNPQLRQRRTDHCDLRRIFLSPVFIVIYGIIFILNVGALNMVFVPVVGRISKYLPEGFESTGVTLVVAANKVGLFFICTMSTSYLLAAYKVDAGYFERLEQPQMICNWIYFADILIAPLFLWMG